jgi:alkanesulfonate monooxygenase SsuD/methylene tetrahydromethanopterin reductase-like flavin-dependent oxidoreductase (luciferase family)
MEFGIFDHLDRSPSSLADYYEERLAIVELFDRAGFHAYHLAEHHGTPLGMGPSPAFSWQRSRNAPSGCASGR